MDFRLRKWLIPALLTFLLSGCASVPLKYDHPTSAKSSSTELKIALIYPFDQRFDNDVSVDKVLKGDPLEDLNKIILEEVQSTGLFKEVIPVAREIPMNKVPEICREMDLVMHSCLRKMAWVVPDYQKQQATAFATGFAFGLVGGMVYGMTKTDVYGDASIRITVVRQSTGETLIDKDYEAHVVENMTKLNSDTPKTRSALAGKAIKSVMEQVKVDLEKVVQRI